MRWSCEGRAEEEGGKDRHKKRKKEKVKEKEKDKTKSKDKDKGGKGGESEKGREKRDSNKDRPAPKVLPGSRVLAAAPFPRHLFGPTPPAHAFATGTNALVSPKCIFGHKTYTGCNFERDVGSFEWDSLGSSEWEDSLLALRNSSILNHE